MIPGEHEFQIFRAEVTARNFTKHVAVSGWGGSRPSKADRSSIPATVHNLAAAHRVAHHKHRVRMSVIRARLPFSLTVGQTRTSSDNHVVHSLAQVLIERRDSRTKLLQQVRQLTTAVALVDVSVPLAHVGERDLQPTFDLINCAIVRSELPNGFAGYGAVLGFVLRGIYLLQIVDRFKRLAPGSGEHVLVCCAYSASNPFCKFSDALPARIVKSETLRHRDRRSASH